MITVVEGPDGSGKTTLIEKAREAIGTGKYFWILRHSCRPLNELHIGDFLGLLAYYRQRGPKDGTVPSLIVDRHPMISEPIYGPLLRGFDLCEEVSFGFIADELQRGIDRIVYCRPTMEKIREKLAERSQLPGISEKIGRIIDLYDACFDRISRYTRIPIVEYDYERNPNPNYRNLLFGE